MDKKEIAEQADSLYSFILNRIASTIKAKRLSTLVDERPMTLQNLAKITGVSTTVISDLENKVYLPKVDVILRLVVALKISLDELLKGKDTKAIKTFKFETDKAHAYSNIDENLFMLNFNDSERKEILTFIDFKERFKQPKYSDIFKSYK